MMRFQYNSNATIKRLSSYSGNKSSFASTGTTVGGFFIPIEPSQKTTVLGIIGQAYEFTCDGSKDIRVNDILTINNIEYGVAGVARYQLASQDFLKVTLQLQSNG